MAKELNSKVILESPKEQTTPEAFEIIEEIFNEPTIIKYKEKGEIKTIEVSRMTLLSIEKAISAFFKLISLFKPTVVGGSPSVDINYSSLIMLSNSNDLKVVREVVVTCLNISSEELSKFPPKFVLKIIEAWININKTEITEFIKSFFQLKENLKGYATDLNQIFLTNKQ